MEEAIQRQLNLFTAARAEQVADVLAKSPVWLSASEILNLIGLPNTETNRRHIRHCAEAFGDEIISGQKGYCHIDNASEEDVKRFCNWMTSQADKMTTRATRTRARKGI
jgi:hypothetical protein